jgi:hypothetical protein
MKFIDYNANFMRFTFFKTVYTQFHLDKPISLFLHKLFTISYKIIRDYSFIKNKTAIDSSRSLIDALGWAVWPAFASTGPTISPASLER